MATKSFAERLVLGFFSKDYARDALERAEGGPRWLWWVHFVGVVGWMVCVSGRTTYVEAGGALLWIMTLVRLPWIWRAVVMGLAHPLFLALIVWTAWRAVSLFWSPDVVQGVDQIDKMRFVWNIPFLLPFAPVVGSLALGLVAGFFYYNLSQVSHSLSRGGVEWLPQWDRMPNRNSGWNEPVAGGTNLCAALGLHLAVLIKGKGWWVAFGAAGTLITLAAILVTGTRGAWIAAAGLVFLACVVGVWKVRWMAKRAVAAAIVSVILLGAGVAVGWKVAAPRAMEAREELRQVFVEKDFSSFTGARLLLMWWGVQAFQDHPIGGTGEGGYKPWVEANLGKRGIDPADRTHTGPHPHNTLLQPLANTGIIGFGLYAVVLLMVARIAWVMRLHEHPYAAGVPWALLGLFMACMFEVMHMNTHVLGMWMLLMGLAVSGSVNYVVRHDGPVGGDGELEGLAE